MEIGQAAQALHRELGTRGIPGLRLAHGYDRWLISLPSGLTIWSENPGVFRWAAYRGGHRTQPTADLIDVAESVVRHNEEAAANSDNVL